MDNPCTVYAPTLLICDECGSGLVVLEDFQLLHHEPHRNCSHSDCYYDRPTLTLQRVMGPDV